MSDNSRASRWLRALSAQSGFPSLLLTLLAVVSGSSNVHAEDLIWNGACGTTNWSDWCLGGPCNDTSTWHHNNWGRNACPPDQLDFPGPDDDVYINDAIVELISQETVGTLTINALGEFQWVGDLTLDVATNYGTVTVRGPWFAGVYHNYGTTIQEGGINLETATIHNYNL